MEYAAVTKENLKPNIVGQNKSHLLDFKSEKIRKIRTHLPVTNSYGMANMY
jgi:hypothetical protein